MTSNIYFYLARIPHLHMLYVYCCYGSLLVSNLLDHFRLTVRMFGFDDFVWYPVYPDRAIISLHLIHFIQPVDFQTFHPPYTGPSKLKKKYILRPPWSYCWMHFALMWMVVIYMTVLAQTLGESDGLFQCNFVTMFMALQME